MVETFHDQPHADEESAFIELALRYLDDELTDVEARSFIVDVGNVPQHRSLFVALCIQSQVMVEKLSAKSASDLLLQIDPNAALHGVPIPKTLDIDTSPMPFSIAPGAPAEAVPPTSAASKTARFKLADVKNLPTVADLAEFPRTGIADRPGTPGEIPSAETEASEDEGVSGPSLRIGFPSRRTLRWAAMVLLPVLIGAGVFALRPGNHATLTAMAGAQWDTPNDGLKLGDKLSTRPLFLKTGVAQITFADGVTMVVEGPARFQVQSQSTTELFAGKLAATVPPAGHGFTVKTASARVIDLGTEFGVSFGDDGLTHIDVFKGSVEAVPQSAGADAGLARTLGVGESAQVSASSVVIDPAGAMPQHFVRSFVVNASTLELTDLIAGGDGTTGRHNIAIDIQTGNAGILAPVATQPSEAIFGYRRVGNIPVVDGIFIPNDSTQIDSVGHQFPFAGTTGTTFNHIWVGGHVPSPKQNSPPFAPAFDPTLGGIDYSKAGHSFVFLHSNKGMTIDLAAIRRLHPGHSLEALDAVVGNIVTIPGFPARSDVVVLVDGESRFSREGLAARDGPAAVHVPLFAWDRFLTLAVTDGGDGTAYDWVIFADPKLELAGAVAGGQ